MSGSGLAAAAEKIAANTGCLVEEAEATLQEVSNPRWAEQLIESNISARRRQYGQQLAKVWAKFVGDSRTETMDIDATIDFVSNGLEIDLENPVVLSIAYELKAPSVGRFDRYGFIDGWARLQCRSVQEMKAKIPMLQTRLEEDEQYFRHVYVFIFHYALVEGSRLLPLELAVAYWELVLVPRYAIAAKWISFAQAQGKNISIDTWKMVLEFCKYANTDPTLANYDATAAWPAVIDDFVDSVESH